MGLFSNLASSITGSVDKALLCVRKPAQAKAGDSGDGSVLGKAASAAGLNGSPSGILSNIDLRAKLVAEKKGFLSSFKAVDQAARSSGYHVLQVKYNPARLKLSGSAESRMAAGAGGAGLNMQVQSMLPAETLLQVELLFDDENHQDAFMWDKMTNLSTGAVVSDVSGIVKNVASDGYSVQRDVEALIALITQSETRQVVFYWGDTVFAGIVTTIDAKYTMFNPIGHPVRGVVTLTIHQGGYDADGKGEDSYWSAAFDTMFDSGSKLGKAAGVVGNIFNLR